MSYGKTTYDSPVDLMSLWLVAMALIIVALLVMICGNIPKHSHMSNFSDKEPGGVSPKRLPFVPSFVQKNTQKSSILKRSILSRRVLDYFSVATMALLCLLIICFMIVSVSLVTGGSVDRDTNYFLGNTDLLNASIEELANGLASGTFTSVDLTKAYILRINEVNPTLNAVTEVNPDALSIAAALDRERSRGLIRSPLHGLPIIIKNNIATADKMNNSAGSYALLGATVRRDAGVAARLRTSGVIILGKANLSQWSSFRSSNSSSGWSAVGGQVTGAYLPRMNPGGSSSGSAVITSLGLAVATLGTETAGSIIIPAGRNNLVGIKPTVGLTSRSLVVPISEHQDTVGPIARTVSDAASILSIIAGKDKFDNYTSEQPFITAPDYRLSLNLSSFQGARIGIPRNIFVFDLLNYDAKPMMESFEAAIGILRSAGAVIVDNANYSAVDEWLVDIKNEETGKGTVVLQADFLSNLPHYLSQLVLNPHEVHNLLDVQNFTRNCPVEEYPTRNTLAWDTTLGLGFNNTDYRWWEAYQFTSYLGGEGGVTGALEKYNLDALVMPTVFAAPHSAYVGLPVVTVPLGFFPNDTNVVKTPDWDLIDTGPNIPFGLAFSGPKWSEEKLIGFAYSYEQRTHIGRMGKPYLIPRTQLTNVVSRGGSS